jgi:galactokinase
VRTFAAQAPGRVELLGNHTDYNDGFVLGAAIDRCVKVEGEKRSDGKIRIRWKQFGEVELHVSESHPLTRNRWANYTLGVTRELLDAGAGITGYEAEVSSDLPIGVGLSGSAAFELATALFLLRLFPYEIAPLEIAKACQRAEHYYAGVQSGLLDQIASLFGRADHVVFFDCRSEQIQTMPFPPGLELIIAESGKSRELMNGEYNLRREQTHAAARALGVVALRDVSSAELVRRHDLPDLLHRRAAHIIGENERVLRAVELLRNGDSAGFGKLMDESHESSRANFENSTPELDLLVGIARELRGVLGARLTGAGFGGAAVILCERDVAEAGEAELSRRYFETSGIKANSFICRVADGATRL